uniref:CLIP domain-containing serine protease n=1 Tax=Anopheles dirus TaxID=7168 RepID=A0A182N5R5_9DIPT
MLRPSFATPWGNYYEYDGHSAGPQLYQYNQRVEHHRTVPDSATSSSGSINCRCTRLRYCARILEMLRNPKSSYGSFNAKLKELACGYGTDNEPNICCPVDDSWLRDTEEGGHSSEENDSHSAIGWDEGYTNRKSDTGHQWSKERFKYIPLTAGSGKRPGGSATSSSPDQGKQKHQSSNAIAHFEDPKTMKNCPPEIYPNDVEVPSRAPKPYVAPVMRTTKRPAAILGSNRLSETTTMVAGTTELPATTTDLMTTVLPTVVPDQPMINAPLCGLSVNTRIVGGETEVPGQFPWMARLAYRNRTSGRVTYRCAGSLITNRHVITVAHCVTNLIDELQLVSIRLGDLECNAVTDTRCSARFQDFAIERILPHESYDVPKYANDIALIKLRETTETYNIISPLCLPTDQYAPYALNLTGQMGIIAGWGSTSNQQCSLPDNSPGECILLRNCNSLLTLIKKKPLLEADRTYLQRTQCGWSTADNHPMVCCPDALAAPVRLGSGLLPTPGQCGIQTSDRIFGGVNTRIDEFPWIALLKYAKRRLTHIPARC